MDDHELERLTRELVEDRDRLTLQVTALTAIVATIAEQQTVSPRRVALWSEALSRRIDGLSKREVCDTALAILEGLRHPQPIAPPRDHGLTVVAKGP